MSSSDRMGSEVDPASFLRANSEAYEWLVRKVQSIDRRREPDEVLRWVEQAAYCAGNFHPGRFADGAIENVAFEVGAELDRDGDLGVSLPPQQDNANGLRRILHVTSQAVGIGGHTRLLAHWVQSDRSSRHSLIIVKQQGVPIPSWLVEAVRNSGGEFVALPPEWRIRQKAKWLRQMARSNADLVVLHHFCDDVVPTVAFATPDCPPVAVLNQADHQFWLGSSVTDIVVSLRTAGAEHTAERRYLLDNVLLPVPLSDPAHEVDRAGARRDLGIGRDVLAVLSVARAEKFRPCGTYDFVATANKLLRLEPRAQLYVVGESAAGMSPYLRGPVHERLFFAGAVDDPSRYRAAADVYIESFPFGSQTALLEAALVRLPVVPAYAPLSPLLVANDDAVQDLLPNPRTEEEYIGRAHMLLQHPEQRRQMGETLRQRLLVDHVGQGWLDRLAAVYRRTDALRHRPKPIPESPALTTDADLGLSLWSVMTTKGTRSAFAHGYTVEAALTHASCVSRLAGDFAAARRHGWRAVRISPFEQASWRLLVAALLGKTGKVLTRWLTPAPLRSRPG